jgi:DNA polymerase-1
MKIQQVNALPDLSHKAELAFDIETTRHDGKNSDPYSDRIVSLQVSDGDNVWVLRNNYQSASPFLTNPDIKKLAHNASFDVKFLKHHLGGIEINNIHDTLLAERLIQSGRDGVSNGLDEVLARRTGVYTDKSVRDQFANHYGDFTEQQLDYMAKDVVYLPKIRQQQLDEIGKAGMGRVLSLENSIVPVVAQMELDGIGFDREMWKEHLIWFEQKKEEIKQRVAEYLDVPSQASLFGGMEIGINLSSTEQVKTQLAELGINLFDTREATLQDTIEYHTTTELSNQGNAVRFMRDVLEWRGWEKLIGYAYHTHVNPITGRIHASWNQLAAQTGRFSCSNPNLQQVRRPVEGEPNLRAAFIPDYGEVLVIADYSQQEPRVLAQLVGDPAMLRAASETDMYTALGEPVYNRKITKKDAERQRLKIGLLAYFYGAYAKKLAYVLGVSFEEAQAFVSRLDTAFPKAIQNGKQRVQFVAQRGYMTSLMGRRCWLLGAVGASQDEMWRYRNQALNGPVQMSSADITKLAMQLFYTWTKENGYDRVRIRMAIHDELVVSCPETQADEVLYNLKAAMETAMSMICPDVRPEVEAGIKPHWTKV